ncbi:MAG TPA: hypothetical protein DCE23_06125, partial [Firmicutes bacterium]|nr:hypothetical protein [Bacillota bacterium]
AYNDNNIEIHDYYTNRSEDSLYLSDINYVSNQSYVGWDRIRYDQIENNGKISLKIENSAFVFKKGIWAHATSQITYDISNYNYKYFTAFVGINTSSSSGNGVIFSVYTSETGTDWVRQKPLFQETKLPGQNATKVKVSIEGAKYLRLIANSNGSNANDHSVYADAKLVNSLEETYDFKSVDDYNTIIKEQYTGQEEITGDLEFNLLRREFVKRIGQFTLSSYKNASEGNKETVDWLFNNIDVLRYFILGGVPERSYYNSLTELTKIYTAHKEDFSNAEVTKYGTKLSDLYTRMAIAMALTHDFKFGLWIDQSPENLSIAETRYRIYKDLHKNGNFIVLRNADGTPKLKADGTPELDITEWFENYSVEEMRYIFNNQSDDEEVLWLNEYTQSFIDASGNYWTYLSPHPYMDYRPENLGQAAFYDPAKKDDWDKTFKGVFSKYNVTYRNGLRKIWMFLRNDQGVLTGAVCGGISKIGTMTRTSHGIPAVVVGQPGHAAIVYYWQDAKGNGYWTLDNDVFGWQQSERGERLPLGWGNANSNYARGSHQVVYLALSQEALNDYDNLVKAEELVMLSDVYTTDEKDKKEETYRKAIEKQSFNLDAWLGLINLYLSDNTKTEEQLYNLSEEVAEALKYYPLPMYQLTNLIKPRLTSVEFNYKFTLLQTRILTEASLTPNNTADRYTVYQPSLTRLEANYLLGSLDRSIATFSFDGADAGKIVLSNRFNGTGIRWDYAINGKGENGTWDVSDFKEVSFSAEEEHKLQLTPEEIASITSENDIYIHIVGVGYEETNLYKIDITESAGLPSTLFANDLENRIIGAVDTIEWKYNESDEWKRYGVEQPDLTGDKKIILRMGAIGTKLAQKTNVTYTFTQDSDNNRRKYIPVEHISLVDASSQATNQQGSAAFALDANYNTRWHSAWDGSDTRRFITVKLDSPRNISAVEFVPAGGGNGKIYDGTIWGSMDGVNWSVLTRKTGLTYTNQADTVAQAMGNIKSFDIEDVQRVQYIRIVADRTNGNWITARAFNFYEDTTLRIVASFSFDGNEAGKINLIDPEYNNNWRYSLDGGNSWTSTSGSSRQLTDAEISQITSENGIKLMLAEDDTIYSIKIKEADELVLNPYVNDLENRLIGLTDVSNFEWKYSDTNSWTSYSSEEPIVKGTKTLQVRTKAMGITLPSNILEFDFTEDNQTKTARYIPIKHLTIHGYSTQSIDATRPFYAPNVIDGNPNTIWHTDFRYNVKNQDIKPFVTIKLDSPRNISALDFIQKKYRADNPDDIQNLRAYVSLDGKEWTLAGIIEDCERDNLEKTVKFDKPVYGQYVKLEMDTYDIFASLANVNLYEDVSMTEANISIQYSTTNKTNRNVVATLVSDKDITITNNGGLNTYTFDENGQFIFEYIDATGEAKSFIALVDWIDKKAPIGTISYSVRDVTNENVIVTLTTDEEVIITNNGGKNTYEFSENGTFTFEFEDAAGNKGTSKADVTWINKKAPVGKVSYSTTKPTNGSVVATLIVADDVIVTNNSGSKEYTFTKNGEFTFEFVDKAGNRGTYTAKVSWIDRTAPKAAVTYSTKEFTNKNVTATLIANEEVTITNNGGSDKYVFNENGEFTFEFKDKAGNISEYTAKVDWIDKVAPTADIRYSTTDLTNEDVIAYLINASEDVTIVNNDGLLTHTFSENGSFVFEIRDKAGNTNKIEAIVSNIDKEVPTAKIKYSLTKPTNKNVIATLVEESEEITVTNNSGLKTYTFTENGTFEFEIVDKAGNTNKVEAIVSNIDKKAPTAEIEYSTTDLTNEDVIAKLVNASEEITITNNNGSNTYLFTKNGEFTFEFVDKAGNTGIAKAVVNNINKDIANAKITYSKNELTNEDVTATVTFDKDGITITNNDGNNTYIFTENGKFKFEYIDKSGNAGVAIAEVTWIDKEAPSADVEYSTADLTNQDVTVRLVNASEDITIVNNNGSDTYTFTENGTFEFEIVDKAGNTSKIEATVSNIDKILPTAKVKYSTTEATNENVITTLTLSEEATIVNTNLEYTKN